MVLFSCYNVTSLQAAITLLQMLFLLSGAFSPPFIAKLTPAQPWINHALSPSQSTLGYLDIYSHWTVFLPFKSLFLLDYKLHKQNSILLFISMWHQSGYTLYWCLIIICQMMYLLSAPSDTSHNCYFCFTSFLMLLPITLLSRGCSQPKATCPLS